MIPVRRLVLPSERGPFFITGLRRSWSGLTGHPKTASTGPESLQGVHHGIRSSARFADATEEARHHD
jgi:hypothetical protein